MLTLPTLRLILEEVEDMEDMEEDCDCDEAADEDPDEDADADADARRLALEPLRRNCAARECARGASLPSETPSLSLS